MQTFQDQGVSDYVVCYLRILTSGYLQSNAEFYQAFVEGGRTVKEYCSQVSHQDKPRPNILQRYMRENACSSCGM